MNTNTNNDMTKEINNRYGHLLDKYINAGSYSDPNNKETREYIRDVENGRYGHLLDNVPDPLQKRHDTMIRLEDMAIERRERRNKEKEYAELAAQERIKVEKVREQIHRDRIDSFSNGLMERKKAKIEAEETQKAKEREEAQRQQDYLNSIDRYMRINPKLAEEVVNIVEKCK